MFEITSVAKTQLLSLMKADNLDKNCFVRIGVEAGGCSGLSYKLNFDTKQQDSDKLVESNGVKVLIDKKSFLYVIGTTLNYFGGLNGKGFVFENPNANRTCGCGESFSI
jgi:iron-sulfur cluster assembly protein